MTPQSLLEHLQKQQGDMIGLLRTLVELESPTDDKEAVDRLGRFVADTYRRTGATVEVLPRQICGDHLRVTFGEGDGQVLVLAHLDTVWPVGTAAARPFRVAGDHAYGPGVNDDKGGVMMAMWAVQTMAELGLTPNKRVVILHNADEEGGSRDSRALIAEEAARSAYVLVLEVTMDNGAVKTARRGGGTFRLRAHGRAAHAGNDMANGIHANEELAHHVLWLQGLNDESKGLTVNVGVIKGGTRPGVVPAQAELTAYFRAWDARRFDELREQVEARRPCLPGARIEVEWGPLRPPYVRTPAVAALFGKARDLAAELGFDLQEGAAGSGSDGNLAAATGTPTLDGLGPVGRGPHADDESVNLARLPERIALLIRLLQVL